MSGKYDASRRALLANPNWVGISGNVHKTGRKRPDEERPKLAQPAAMAKAVHDLPNVADAAAKHLGSSARLVVDLTPEGLIHSWQTLIGVCGFHSVMDLFKLGLDRSEPRLLADHIDQLLDIVEAIALQIEDEDADSEEGEGQTDTPDETALAPSDFLGGGRVRLRPRAAPRGR